MAYIQITRINWRDSRGPRVNLWSLFSRSALSKRPGSAFTPSGYISETRHLFAPSFFLNNKLHRFSSTSFDWLDGAVRLDVAVEAAVTYLVLSESGWEASRELRFPGAAPTSPAVTEPPPGQRDRLWECSSQRLVRHLTQWWRTVLRTSVLRKQKNSVTTNPYSRNFNITSAIQVFFYSRDSIMCKIHGFFVSMPTSPCKRRDKLCSQLD